MATVADRRRETEDHYLLYLTLALLVIGVALVLDSSYARTAELTSTGQDPFHFLKRQGSFALLGVFCMYLASRFPYWRLRSMGPYIMFAAAAALLAVLVPGLGHMENGARRWIGPAALHVQPSEIAKIALVIYLAGMLARSRRIIKDPWIGFMPPAAIVIAICLLIEMEPDLGTATVVFATGMSMLYLGGAELRHIATVCGMAFMAVLVTFVAHPYRMERIRIWLDPQSEYARHGLQAVQGLIAVSTGGTTGVGLAAGRGKYFLPAYNTDYIFATLAEETGLLGTVVLIGMFALLVAQGLRVARRCDDPFGTLLACGLTLTIGWQAIINIAVVTNSIPATGVPLPLMSYGGTSLVIMLTALGILINIARTPARQPRQIRRER